MSRALRQSRTLSVGWLGSGKAREAASLFLGPHAPPLMSSSLKSGRGNLCRLGKTHSHIFHRSDPRLRGPVPTAAQVTLQPVTALWSCSPQLCLGLCVGPQTPCQFPP